MFHPWLRARERPRARPRPVGSVSARQRPRLGQRRRRRVRAADYIFALFRRRPRRRVRAPASRPRVVSSSRSRAERRRQLRDRGFHLRRRRERRGVFVLRRFQSPPQRRGGLRHLLPRHAVAASALSIRPRKSAFCFSRSAVRRDAISAARAAITSRRARAASSAAASARIYKRRFLLPSVLRGFVNLDALVAFVARRLVLVRVLRERPQRLAEPRRRLDRLVVLVRATRASSSARAVRRSEAARAARRSSDMKLECSAVDRFLRGPVLRTRRRPRSDPARETGRRTHAVRRVSRLCRARPRVWTRGRRRGASRVEETFMNGKGTTF